MTTEPVDIAEELEARGDALSLRAARYISIKRTTERGLREQLQRASHEREPPHCSTCACGVLSEFHNLDDLAEIERLSAENHRLNLKCSALALLHYGSPGLPAACGECGAERGALKHADGCRHSDVPAEPR
jgi:hypothetical protein